MLTLTLHHGLKLSIYFLKFRLNGFRPPDQAIANKCADRFSLQSKYLVGRIVGDASAKADYKPSSVLRDYGVATIYLACPLPDRSSGQPGYGPEPYIPLLGLAPNGVYLDQRCLHPCGGLLPHHFTLTDMQRYISVALSVGSPRPAVSGHSSERARTFLLL